MMSQCKSAKTKKFEKNLGKPLKEIKLRLSKGVKSDAKSEV